MSTLEIFQISLKMLFIMAIPKHQDDLLEVVKTDKPKTPPLYKVILFNDDYTPMEFVVEVLQRFFSKGREQATQIMLQIHTKGAGVCGVYPYDIAETKVNQVMTYAREHQHPLQCGMEQA